MVNHMPYGITQWYLPPGSGNFPAFNTAEAGTRFCDPGGMQGWLDLSGGYISGRSTREIWAPILELTGQCHDCGLRSMIHHRATSPVITTILLIPSKFQAELYIVIGSAVLYRFHGRTHRPQHFSMPSRFFSAARMSWLIWSIPSPILSICSAHKTFESLSTRLVSFSFHSKPTISTAIIYSL